MDLISIKSQLHKTIDSKESWKITAYDNLSIEGKTIVNFLMKYYSLSLSTVIADDFLKSVASQVTKNARDVFPYIPPIYNENCNIVKDNMTHDEFIATIPSNISNVIEDEVDPFMVEILSQKEKYNLVLFCGDNPAYKFKIMYQFGQIVGSNNNHVIIKIDIQRSILNNELINFIQNVIDKAVDLIFKINSLSKRDAIATQPIKVINHIINAVNSQDIAEIIVLYLLSPQYCPK